MSARFPEVPVIEVSSNVIAKMCYRDSPEGFLALMRDKRSPIGAIEDGCWLICSGVEKPGNLGAMLRSADAAGAAGMMIDSRGFDLFNPNCIRASTGAVFSVPVVCEDRETLLKRLQDQAFRIVAATPRGPQIFPDVDLKGPVALVLGSESQGIDPFWLEAAEVTVRIAQQGIVDSLNVSVTAALLMFEARRQANDL